MRKKSPPKNKKTKKAKFVNAGNFWKPEKKQTQKGKAARKPGFYSSDAWLKLRVDALEYYGGECCLCGKNKKQHNVVMHVDHIKPRSTHPHLELCFSNLQVLCEECNLGKGNRYSVDHRPADKMAGIKPEWADEDWS